MYKAQAFALEIKKCMEVAVASVLSPRLGDTVHVHFRHHLVQTNFSLRLPGFGTNTSGCRSIWTWPRGQPKRAFLDIARCHSICGTCSGTTCCGAAQLCASCQQQRGAPTGNAQVCIRGLSCCLLTDWPATIIIRPAGALETRARASPSAL